MKRFLFILVILLQTHILIPEPVILSENKSYRVGRYLRIFEDKKKELTIDDVSVPEMEKYFHTSEMEIPNYGYTKSAFWIKITIINTSREHDKYYFSFNHPTLDKIDCYIPYTASGDPGKKWIIKKSGDCYPLTVRDIINRNHIFIIPTGFGRELTVFFRVNSDSTMTFPCEIMSRDVLYIKDRYEQFFYGIYYGIITIMILYHLVLFFFLRDKIYIIYAAYVFMTGFFLFSLNGFTAEFFGFLDPWLVNRTSTLSGAMALVTALIFGRFFLDLKKKAPFIDKAILILLFGSLFVALSSFLPDYSFSTNLLNYFTISIGICGIIAGFVRWQKGFKPASYWILAFTFLEIGIIFFGLRNLPFLMHVVPNNFLVSNGIQLGFILQIFLLSLGLGNRLNLIRQQKEQAQELAIKNLNDANTMKDEFLERIEQLNLDLERKIDERTKKLSEANKKLSELAELKNDFIANITHDFRSPLTIILNSTELMLNNKKDYDEKDMRKLENIFNSSIKLKNTIDKLLDLARLDTTGIQLHVNRIDFKSFLTGLVDFYKSSIFLSNIDIVMHLPQESLTDFYSDRGKLEQILDNIISNALKYLDAKNGRIDIELVLSTKNVRIIVKDNGIGIPPDKLDAIFERFVRIKGERNYEIKGSGIGLAFSKQLVELLHGRVWAESGGLGKGASFFIELPLDKDVFKPDDFMEAEKEESSHYRETTFRLLKDEIEEKLKRSEYIEMINELNQEREYNKKKALILLIDDEKKIRDIELEYLQNAGYKNFILASDGKQGIEAAYTYHPDIIICDYNMPNMNGEEFHDELCTNPDFKKIPFIFISAILEKNVIIERKRKGAVAYLPKPVDHEDFLLTLDLHLGKLFELKKMEQLTVIDELTGLRKHNEIINIIHNTILSRKLINTAIAFFDIDHFKAFNDTFGHQIGDKVLAGIGEIVLNSIRKSDIPGRYGGEEFIVMFPDTNLDKAVMIAENLKKNIEKEKIHYKGRELAITASFGISSLFEYENYICKRIGIKSFEYLTGNKAQNRESFWRRVNQLKTEIADILIQMADKGMYMAKSTVCKSCGFFSEKEDLFQDGKCPECGTGELIPGRGRIVVFHVDFDSDERINGV